MARAIAGEIPVPPPADRDPEPAVRAVVAPPTVERVATPLPEQPPQRPFVGPGRRPGRAGRARRFATWLASASAILLFVAPISWLATARPRRPIPQETVALPFVAPFETQNVDSAIALARRSGARTVVMGEARTEGDSVVVVATTYDVATGAVLGQAQRRASVGADPRALLDTLARSLPRNPAGQAGEVRQNNP